MKSFFLLFFAFFFSKGAIATEKSVVEYETYPAVWAEEGGSRLRYEHGYALFDCTNESGFIMDAAVPYFSCETKDGWFSITTSYLAFSINKGWSKLPDQWEKDGYSYNVVTSKKKRSFGEVTTIVAFEKSNPSKYYVVDFSKKKGVVRFFFLDEETSKSEWFELSSKFGLGAGVLKP